jgi:hypothetical protein
MHWAKLPDFVSLFSAVLITGSYDHKVPVLRHREWYRLGDKVKGLEVSINRSSSPVSAFTRRIMV